MAKLFDEITPALREFIAAQPVFFVGTAPSGDDGHVNVSPKGGANLFHVTGPLGFAYVDLMGSGIETIAHLKENGRIVVMFCAFSGPPRIVRLHGRGVPMLAGTPEFAGLAPCFPEYVSARAIIRIALDRVSDSCGFGVPRMHIEGERDDLIKWAERKGPDGIAAYWADTNVDSLDGLPGI